MMQMSIMQVVNDSCAGIDQKLKKRQTVHTGSRLIFGVCRKKAARRQRAVKRDNIFPIRSTGLLATAAF
jgi:hypothetical protein